MSTSIKIIIILLLHSSFVCLAQVQKSANNIKSSNKPDSSQLEAASRNIKLEREKYFIENKGQLADDKGVKINNIQFYGDLAGVSFFLHKKGIQYKFSKHEKRKEKIKHHINNDQHLSCSKSIDDSIITTQMDMELLDADTSSIVIIKENPSKAYYNFYYPHCPGGVLNVKGYSTVIYKNIYPKIDMKVYHFGGNVKYDFIVHPGGNPNKIKMKFKGHDSIKINNSGNLEVKNPLGKVIEEAPFTYQTKTYGR